MKYEDLASIRWFRKKLKKYPDFRFFVASKIGNNNVGKGVNRAVILGTWDKGKTWVQVDKVWGYNNLKRAEEIVRQAKLSDSTPSVT